MVRDCWIVKIGNSYAIGVRLGVVTGSKHQDDAKRFSSKEEAEAFIAKIHLLPTLDRQLKVSAIMWHD